MRSAATCVTLLPFASAVLLSEPRRRSVSKAPGQHVVDGDVLVGDGARHAGEKRGQARARARRQIEAGDRCFHRTGGDVDDAAELALRHRVDHLLYELDCHHHVGGDAVEDLLARQFAEIAQRRAAIVVDQDVGLRAGGEQRLLALRCGDVGGDGDDLGLVSRADSAAVASSTLASRPLMTTSQPASAKARAQALPSPRLDAQTMALRPAIPRSMGFP